MLTFILLFVLAAPIHYGDAPNATEALAWDDDIQASGDLTWTSPTIRIWMIDILLPDNEFDNSNASDTDYPINEMKYYAAD